MMMARRRGPGLRGSRRRFLPLPGPGGRRLEKGKRTIAAILPYRAWAKTMVVRSIGREARVSSRVGWLFFSTAV